MMMKKEAEKFLVLVNTPGNVELLSAYADYRIEKLMQRFLHASSMEELKSIQAAIEEIKRLKILRDEVINPINTEV